jgi:uncharacterized lipoprotein YajG
MDPAYEHRWQAGGPVGACRQKGKTMKPKLTILVALVMLAIFCASPVMAAANPPQCTQGQLCPVNGPVVQDNSGMNAAAIAVTVVICVVFLALFG